MARGYTRLQKALGSAHWSHCANNPEGFTDASAEGRLLRHTRDGLGLRHLLGHRWERFSRTPKIPVILFFSFGMTSDAGWSRTQALQTPQHGKRWLEGPLSAGSPSLPAGRARPPAALTGTLTFVCAGAPCGGMGPGVPSGTGVAPTLFSAGPGTGAELIRQLVHAMGLDPNSNFRQRSLVRGEMHMGVLGFPGNKGADIRHCGSLRKYRSLLSTREQVSRRKLGSGARVPRRVGRCNSHQVLWTPSPLGHTLLTPSLSLRARGRVLLAGWGKGCLAAPCGSFLLS